MSLNSYQAFLRAAETGSFTKAAEQLGYTQSGVSHLIKSLEDELGIALFIRHHGKPRLSREGKMLLPHVRSVVYSNSTLLETVSQLKGLTAGELHIGCFSSMTINILPGLLRSFNDKYPGIDVTIYNSYYEMVESHLTENRIDCGFLRLPTLPEFRTIPFMRDRFIVVFPNDYPIFSVEAELKDFSGFPFILPAEGPNYDIGKLFSESGIVPEYSFDMQDDYAAVAMVAKGYGYTILPELMANSIISSDVRHIPLKGSERQIGLAFNNTRSPSPAMKAFEEHVIEYIKCSKE